MSQLYNNLKEKFITCAGIIFSEMVSDYIGWYGKAIMEKFPKGIVSTTKTRIDQIMTFLIWNYCCFLCIPHFTKKDMAGLQEQGVGRLFGPGTPIGEIVEYITGWVAQHRNGDDYKSENNETR